MGAPASRAVETVTETFIGDRLDQALVAELCQRLGFPPNEVTELHVTSGLKGIRFGITHTGIRKR